MALKVTAGEWTAAQRENQVQRDKDRQRFFEESGVKPAKSLRNIHFSPEKRVNQFAKALGMAGQNRIGDPNLSYINTVAAFTLAGNGMTGRSIPNMVEYQPLGILALSPDILKDFFTTVPETGLGRSLF